MDVPRLLMVICFMVIAVTGETNESKAATATDTTWSDFWVTRLVMNLLGYATILVPATLLIKHLRKIRYNEHAGPGCLPNFVVLCVFGKEQHASTDDGKDSESKDKVPSESTQAFRIFFCVIGLLGSYLTWGWLQERIITIEYGRTATAPGEYFKNSLFLVFVNRILAFVMALMVIIFKTQPPHTAPLYKYSFSSLSNIMSSWCQYEALKFVSFPTQVLAKACKVIPVMLMGKVVSNKSYDFHEYLTAGMISFGVSMFMLSSEDAARHNDTVTITSGLVMLIGYMLFDSFTSNWQGELFTKHKMSSIQMMAGVNMFSCLLTFVSLIEQGGFIESSAFMFRHPEFVLNTVVLSICSATGQLFIFYTIATFGPVVFVIIMTMRQGFAILLSCLYYGHPVALTGIFGIGVVFSALFLRIYSSYQKRSSKRKAVAQADDSEVSQKV